MDTRSRDQRLRRPRSQRPCSVPWRVCSPSFSPHQVSLAMQSSIQDALDELLSPRSPADAKTRALQILEHQLALACLNGSNALHCFKSLQNNFECNIPLRVLAWTSMTTVKLDGMTNKEGREHDVSNIVSQLSLALSVIQGIALIHHASKLYLGRKHALETLLDLLLVSRHVPPSPSPKDSLQSSSSLSSPPPSPHLSSIVLDTLLCILVDSPNSLRSFENANGVQSVVKILKRAGTPREVRMKCLEFLYFYLLDETPAPSKVIDAEERQIPTAPVTPVRVTKKPYLSPMPMLPSSRQTSSSSLLFPTPTLSVTSLASSSRSASSESLVSMTSASTAPSSVASSPDNTSVFSTDVIVTASTPATSPLTHHHRAPVGSPPPVPSLRPKSVQGKEIDRVSPNPVRRRYVASPPLKGNGSRHGPSKSMSAIPSIKISPSISRPTKSGINKSWNEEFGLSPTSPLRNSRESSFRGLARLTLGVGLENTKSTEEKKELLGTMLGNVDALVESVRKAGIWGLS
ncbi:hypothetical protein AX15_007294 [Amanita polypyramis BW_CC]|nr:hypothetical protein AX15_007294 [Amanita polypyramis BW_CC]